MPSQQSDDRWREMMEPTTVPPICGGPHPTTAIACHRCDLDMHRCPGCGVPVDHDVVACEDCANALTGKEQP